MEARVVTLYRHTGEVAADAPDRLPPACKIPVTEGQACDLSAYVPGTNASIFSPQGGVRIGMVDLAKIGQALMRGPDGIGISDATLNRMADSTFGGVTGAAELFCHYGLGLQAIEMKGSACNDRLFGNGQTWVGHPGEAYGLLSGLWFNLEGEQGFVYVTTEAPPPTGGEDTGNFTPREKELMARALEMVAEREP
jgi:hypothetical protein